MYLPYHWHRANKGKVYSLEFCSAVSDGLKRYFQTEPTEAKRRRIEQARQRMANWHKQFHRRPTTPEFVMAQLLPPSIRYVGDGSLYVTLADGKRKNPDFHVLGAKKVIEVFGVWFHRGEDERVLIGKYRMVGWDCLVVWEDAIFSRPTRQIVSQRIGDIVQKCVEFAEE